MGLGKSHWGRLWADTHCHCPLRPGWWSLNRRDTCGGYFWKERDRLFPDERKRCIAQYAGPTIMPSLPAGRGGLLLTRISTGWMNTGLPCTCRLHHRSCLTNRSWMKKRQEAFAKKRSTRQNCFFIQQKLTERLPFYQQAKTDPSYGCIGKNSLDVFW